MFGTDKNLRGGGIRSVHSLLVWVSLLLRWGRKKRK